ncbi:uncharacterized protein LOC119673052 [Teleopsis dalmanni]|uniref:uncharacterized protein LOC119673052 n=1 Tax=Teleopsis dalmanni TaxID=139649 RepID=UPI0018CCE398|nr:uncharacterized protein LOC119673052 [Teleopsis dalmanni]
MAAVVHGCGSPRQHHHGSNISNTNSYLSGSHYQYSTAPKYLQRSAGQQFINTNNHHHSAGHQYNATLPPVSYLPVGSATQLHSHVSSQRPLTAGTIAATGDACCTYWGHPRASTMLYRAGRHHSKRKSAVELLAESKSFFMKPNSITDRLHNTTYRMADVGSSKRGRSYADRKDDRRSVTYGESNYEMDPRFLPSHGHQGSRNAHLHHHHHAHNQPHLGRRGSGMNSSSLLQSKSRLLQQDCYRRDETHLLDLSNGMNPRSCLKELSGIDIGTEDNTAVTLPPPAFNSPQSFDNIYNYGAENSSGDELLVLTENYRPISPPAEYAADTNETINEQRSRYNYQRSYSQSHEIAAENVKYTAAAYNINSHKSLPDLHSQISRHSPHSEILSCCSRGNRSTKSAGESSLNRDSGGSSGHYTHRSEPCFKQRDDDIEVYETKNCCNSATPMDYLRDSGSSTQHSATSYYGYGSPPNYRNYDCTECNCRNATTFESDFLINFTTPEVPEAFQDNYTPPSPSITNYKTEERYPTAYSNQTYGTSRRPSQQSIVQSPDSVPTVGDISPPPIKFKRQKCIRLKNHSRILLPSTTNQRVMLNKNEDLGPLPPTPLMQKQQQQTFVFPKCFSTDGSYQHTEKLHSGEYSKAASVDIDYEHVSDSILDLERFFDRLGLNDEKFHEIYSPIKRADSDSDNSSTVFFSDVSTVDSMRLPDSTDTQVQANPTYRPSEPLSIVERNARIIKWLCNCKKSQYA